MIKNLKYLFLIFGVCFIAGCGVSDSAKVGSAVDQDFLNASDALEKAKNPTAEVSNDTVSTSEGVWLGDTSVVLPYKNVLPAIFESENGITLFLEEPANLSSLSNTINQITGIPVKIDKQVDSAKLQKSSNISYSGSLSGFLNQITKDLDILWYYDKYNIVFYETETKTFSLYALGTEVQYDAGVTGEDDSNFVKLSSVLKEWDEIDKTLSKMTDGLNANYEISSSTGTITVTASPDVLARVERYINQQNKRLSQQIAINVRVLQVTIENSNAFGLNLSAALESVSGLQLVSNPVNNMNTVGNSLNLAVLNNTVKAGAGLIPTSDGVPVIEAGNGSFTPDVIAASSLEPLAGTDALIQALAKQGKISLLTSATVTTRNNRVAPIKNMTSTAYIKSIGSVLGTLGGSESNIIPDTVDTGFSMQLLPNIVENNKIMLLFKMSIKDLIKITTFSSGSSSATVQLPEIDERAFMQEVVMESGQTLVLTGFEQMKNNDTRYGIGDADFMALGGSRETEATRDVLVVIITPQVLVSPMDPEKSISDHWGAPLN